MNKKEKNQLWRMPLFFSLLVTVIYLLIFQKHGALPSGSYFDLLNDLERAQNGLKAFDGIINLPFELSRWFDILFTWLITTYIVRITIWGFADFRKEEPETTVGEKNDDQGFLSIGLMAGTFVGIAASIALSLITSIDGFLMPELILIIIIGLGASMFGSLLGESLGLGFSLTYGMSVSFLFAILNISDFSIALALVLGLATTIISSGGVYIITLVKLIFSGRNINETEIQNKKQTIMVKLKKIILEIADDKDAFFVGMFLIAISLSVAYFVFVFMLIDKNNCSVPIANFGLFQYANYINLGIAIIWLTFSVVVITTYLIIALKVTSFKNSPRRIIILHHKDKYKAELYSQPFWGKCEYNVINIPDNWERVIREGGLKSFKFPFEISINKQLINGLGTETIISFPITIVFYFSGPLGIHDLEKISGDGDKKVIYIDDYILNYFFKVNSDKNILKKIKDAAMIWEDGKISLVGLSRIAEKNIKFSEHIFSNIRKTELHVEISNSRVMEIFEPNLNKKE